jgi:hypothetical protein
MKKLEEGVDKLTNHEPTLVESFSGKNKPGKQSVNFLARAMLLTALVVGYLPLSPMASATGMKVFAMDVKVPSGPKFSLDEDRWISLGMGYRGTGQWLENPGNGNYFQGYSTDNARLYLNGQVHKYLKFEVNTECFWCNNTHANEKPHILYTVLDAIGKFEYNRYFNVWGGRMLVPTERGELSGPFYQATHDAFKTPFFPQDYSTHFGQGGAGRYGRDDGGTFFGSLEPGIVKGTLSYAGGIYRGARSVTPHSDSPSIAGRITYNFLNPEKNPGYYTSSTYFGKAGDILAVAVGSNYQANGAGSPNYRSDFLGVVSDVLLEKVLPNNLGVFTANGEYKRFFAHYDRAAYTDPSNALTGGNCSMCVFDGQSWTITGLHLIPIKIGIGQFQPYGRYTSVQPINSANRTEVEAGVNYIIDGFNARVSAFWQRGDLYTKGLNYSPGAAGATIDIFRLAFQIQM